MQQNNTPELKVELVAPQGFGVGEGAISYAKRAGSEVSKLELTQIERTIHSKRIIVPVDTDAITGDFVDDDGCGDGRGVTDASKGTVEILDAGEPRRRSLNRAKVFGGGATMAAAVLVGIGNVKAGATVESLFFDAMHFMEDAELNFGGHIDEHASEKQSGCGAIDNAPQILTNISKHHTAIHHILTQLEPEIDIKSLNDVLDSFQSYVNTMQADTYTGKKIMDEIKKEKVVKKLFHDHNEMYIVLNDIENFTVNQFAVRDASQQAVQVFAVDLWRIYDIATGLCDEDDEETYSRAVISQLVFTVGTAITLTAGDLPVYRISEV